MSDVTRILSQVESGDPSAAEKLLPLVYEELRKLAAVNLAEEKPGQTLQATALVHEAYVRLVGPSVSMGTDAVPDHNERWNGRAHFFGAAAEAMRRVLIDRAHPFSTARSW
jgi:RNA polymerase sigma factor (TIGR02999 family)